MQAKPLYNLFDRELRNMKSLTNLLITLFCLIAVSTAFAQTAGVETKPKFVKFKTDPPGGIIIINGATYQTSDSDIVWTKVELSPGAHSVIAKGQAKRLTFDLTIDSKLGTFVTVDFDDDKVWALREKAFRSKTVPATIEADSSTTVTKRKKPDADSLAALAAQNAKDTSAQKPAGQHVYAEIDDSAVVIDKVVPRLKDASKIRDITGAAVIKALVNEKGSVVEARIDKSSGSKEFDRAALDAVRKCKYKPATRSGKPVATWITYSVEFTPQGETNPKEDLR